MRLRWFPGAMNGAPTGITMPSGGDAFMRPLRIYAPALVSGQGQ